MPGPGQGFWPGGVGALHRLTMVSVTGTLELMSFEIVIGPSATIVMSPVRFSLPGGLFPKLTAQLTPLDGHRT